MCFEVAICVSELFSLHHNVFVALGASMWLAPFPLPEVESLAPTEGEKTWTEHAAYWSWVGGPKICSVNWFRENLVYSFILEWR